MMTYVFIVPVVLAVSVLSLFLLSQIYKKVLKSSLKNQWDSFQEKRILSRELENMKLQEEKDIQDQIRLENEKKEWQKNRFRVGEVSFFKKNDNDANVINETVINEIQNLSHNFSKISMTFLVCALALSGLFVSKVIPEMELDKSFKNLLSIFSPDKPTTPSGQVLGIENNEEDSNYLKSILASSQNNQPAYTFSDDFSIRNNRVSLKDFTSEQIGRHTIENSNIDSNSITSRTIRNLSISSEDIARRITLQHLTVDDEVKIKDYLLIGEDLPTNIDLESGNAFFSGSLETKKPSMPMRSVPEPSLLPAI